jgi:hypothetical protein
MQYKNKMRQLLYIQVTACSALIFVFFNIFESAFIILDGSSPNTNNMNSPTTITGSFRANPPNHVLSTSLTDDTMSLLKTLYDERNRITTFYQFNIVNSTLPFLIEHGPSHQSLGESLTRSYVYDIPFVVGVTGGSCTAGDTLSTTWVVGLSMWLKKMGILTELRNQAQGGSCTATTASCMQYLVGRNVDLLLWEFEMNDNSDYYNPGKYEDNVQNFEIYLEHALSIGAKFVGFVHIHDLRIRSYFETQNAALPNIGFKPCVDTMRYYSSIFGSWFAFDTIGFVSKYIPSLLEVKQNYVRDTHHPTRALYQIIEDLLVVSILNSWIEYLEIPGQVAKLSPIVSPMKISIDNVERLTPYNSDVLIPVKNVRAHCGGSYYHYVNPTWGLLSQVQLRHPQRLQYPVIPSMKDGSSGRHDVHVSADVPHCDIDNPLIFDVYFDKVGSVMISCKRTYIQSCESLHVTFDGQVVESTSMSSFWTKKLGWIWKRLNDNVQSDGNNNILPDLPVEPVKRAGIPKHTIVICQTSQLKPYWGVVDTVLVTELP